MNRLMKNLIIKKDGVYCEKMNGALKRRLISANKLKEAQEQGYETIPVNISGMGVGLFKFKPEEGNFLMKKTREQIQNNEVRTPNFRENLAVETNNISKQTKYDEYEIKSNTYEAFEER